MRVDSRLLAPLVLVVVGAVTWWATATEPVAVKASVPKATVVPITQTTLVCPQAGGAAPGGAARITYADAGASADISTPAAGGTEPPSTLTTTPLNPAGQPSPIGIQSGHAWVIEGPPTVSPVQIVANGPVSRTLVASQYNRVTVAGALQLAVGSCEGPMTDAWFAGFSSQAGEHTSLWLGNADSIPATVDVTIYADQSGADPTTRRGIKVDPHTEVQVPLDSIEPDVKDAVVRVTSTIGRVVSAVRFDASNGSIPLGFDWLPRTNAPALTQTVPGFVRGAGSRRLIVAVPGSVDATLSLKLVTADGSFTPTEFESLTVKAGTVSRIDLDPVLQAQAATVVVTSSEPVVVGGASALAPNKAGASDVGFTAAVPALSGPTVVSGGEVGGLRHTQLLLAAPDADANVTVRVLPSNSASSPLVSPLSIPAGTLMVLDLGAIGSDPAPGVVVTPTGGGPVYAAWVLQEAGKGTTAFSSLPLRTPLRSLVQPAAQANLVAGFPGAAASSAVPSSPEPASPEPSLPASPADSSAPPADSSAPPALQSPVGPSSSQPSP
ncbi:MAG: hypothetical protein QOJ62_735 [Actinomycetota bacterium]|nr:hypothetical protein [Actinomycetota bacterium]